MTSTLLLLVTLAGTPAPQQAPAKKAPQAPKWEVTPAHYDSSFAQSQGGWYGSGAMAPNWWVRDYVNYQDGAGYAVNYRPERYLRGTYFYIDMNPAPANWGESEDYRPTYRDIVHGAGFGLMLLIMVVVPLGSAIVFLKPRGLSWAKGSPRISRAEAREMLGRL